MQLLSLYIFGFYLVFAGFPLSRDSVSVNDGVNVDSSMDGLGGVSGNDGVDGNFGEDERRYG